MPRLNRITVEMPDDETLALAEMCKRAYIEPIRAFSASEKEAQEMWRAMRLLKQALARAGWAPR